MNTYISTVNVNIVDVNTSTYRDYMDTKILVNGTLVRYLISNVANFYKIYNISVRVCVLTILSKVWNISVDICANVEVIRYLLYLGNFRDMKVNMNHIKNTDVDVNIV